MNEDILARLDRLEAVEEIRQLASRYGAAIDARDIDAVVFLYIDDGRPVWFGHSPRGAPGGTMLHAANRASQSRYSQSQHLMCNHVIDFDDSDRASGVVYALVHQEQGEHWTIAAMQYWYRHERHQNRWLFAERRPQTWYFTEWLHPPTGPLKTRLLGTKPTKSPLPEAFPTWGPFWDSIATDPPT